MKSKRFRVSLSVLALSGIFLLAAGLRLPGADAADPLPRRALAPMLARDSGAPAPPTHTAPTPTATSPAPTATTAPSGVTASQGSWYVAKYTGTIYVVGMVHNGLSSPIGYVQITARFYASDGRLLATDTGYAALDTIPAGGDSPYTALLLDPPAGISRITATVTDYSTTYLSPPVSGLSAEVSNIYVNSIGTLHMVGTVQNNSGKTWEYVQPIVALFDAEGNVVRTDFTFTDPDTLGPGQSGTFDLLILDPPPGAASMVYRIWVDANEP